MKKKLGFILAVVCAAILVCSAIVPAHQDSAGRDVFQVIQKYRSYKGVEAINIGPFIMKLARLTGTEEALTSYETFVEAKEEDEEVRILVKSSKDAETILEMVILAKESDEFSVIAIKGNIPVSQIMEVAGMAEELD